MTYVIIFVRSYDKNYNVSPEVMIINLKNKFMWHLNYLHLLEFEFITLPSANPSLLNANFLIKIKNGRVAKKNKRFFMILLKRSMHIFYQNFGIVINVDIDDKLISSWICIFVE